MSTFTWGTARKMHSFCSGDASSLARRFVDVDTKFAYFNIVFCRFQIQRRRKEMK